MYSGQRVSRQVQALESMAMSTQPNDDDFDDYGVPLNKGSRKSTTSTKKGGFINRFKRSGNSSKNTLSPNYNDDDSDDEGSFEPVPGLNHPGGHSINNNVSSFQVVNGASPFPPQPKQQPTNSPIAPANYHNGNMTPSNPAMPHVTPNMPPLSVNIPSPSSATSSNDIGMDQISNIRDRFRYPSMKDDPNGQRAMSLNSMSNYDTTPIIPMLGPLTSFQSGSSHNKSTSSQDKYRQRMIESRRALLSTESGIPLSGNPMAPQGPPGGVPPPQMPMELPMGSNVSTRSRATSITSNHSTSSLPQNRSNTMNSQMSQQYFPVGNVQYGNQNWRPQNGIHHPMSPGMYQLSPGMQMGPGTPHMGPGSGYPPQMGHPMNPGMPNTGSNMGLGLGGPNMGVNGIGGANQLRHGQSSPALNGQRIMQYHSPLSQSHNSEQGRSAGGGNTVIDNNDFDFGTSDTDLVNDRPHEAHGVTASMVASLEDEVRVLSIELGESVRRELKLDPSSSHADSSKDIAEAYKKLSQERLKRQAIEEASKAQHVNTGIESKLSDLKFSHDEAAHLLAVRTDQYDALQLRYRSLEEDYKNRQENIDSLRKQLQEHEASDAMYAQDEKLKKEVITLQAENSKLRSQLDEVSDRGPRGDRIKALEDQRSALQEALRAMRERKDAEINALNHKIEILSSAIEKRNTSASSIHGNTSTSSLSTRPTLPYTLPRRITSNSDIPGDDSQLTMPKRSRDVSIGRPTTPLNLGLEYSSKSQV